MISEDEINSLFSDLCNLQQSDHWFVDSLCIHIVINSETVLLRNQLKTLSESIQTLGSKLDVLQIEIGGDRIYDGEYNYIQKGIDLDLGRDQNVERRYFTPLLHIIEH